jgi:RNA polymerase sigma-70 factor, ECF subfamily
MFRSLRHAAGASLSPVSPAGTVTSGETRNGAPMEPPGEVTKLLKAWASGDRTIESRLFELVIPDLHRMAECLMRKERLDHTIEPTALLDEAYCRLVKARERDWENRQHFFRCAGRIMRHFLIDYGRRRPKGKCIPIDRIERWLCASGDQLEQAAVIDDLLSRLERLHPDWCTIVELKFFGPANGRGLAHARPLHATEVRGRASMAIRKPGDTPVPGEQEYDDLLMSLVESVIELPPEDREAHLRAVCADTALMEEVRTRIVWEERMGRFLRDPLVHLPAVEDAFAPESYLGRRFRVVREIGRGGMGIGFHCEPRAPLADTVDRCQSRRAIHSKDVNTLAR